MGRKKSAISATDHERITQAIRSAERRTNGEIFAVVAHRSDDYFFVSGFVIALWTLAILTVLAFATWLYSITFDPVIFAAAQFVSLIASLLLLKFVPNLRLWFVPKKIAFQRASAEAVRQFLAHGVHATSTRTGILIYVSLAEHYAEVVADSGIAEKVDQSQWDGMVADLVANAGRGDVAKGFLTAIDRAAGLLALYFPPVLGQENEVDDRLVEL
ncbi:MAG: TPM domain-containing protein [Rhizobiaceae bacterium]